jgi:Protein of unknown function (DUF998)
MPADWWNRMALEVSPMRKRLMSVESRSEVISRGWHSRTVTKALLIAGIVAAGVYVVGDLLSGIVYNASRPYSYKDQWISELTATRSPVRPLMVTVITIHDLLVIALGLGIWRAAGRSKGLRWVGVFLLATHAFGLVIHSFFPMASRWMEQSDAMHGNVTMVWGLGVLVAILLAAVAHGGWFRLYSIGTLVAMIGFGTASAIAIQGIEQNDTPWAGAFERINAYAFMAWLAVLAVTVMRRSLAHEKVEERVMGMPQKKDPALVGRSETGDREGGRDASHQASSMRVPGAAAHRRDRGIQGAEGSREQLRVSTLATARIRGVCRQPQRRRG